MKQIFASFFLALGTIVAFAGITPAAFPFGHVPGSYDVFLTIGDRVFQDELVISKVEPDPTGSQNLAKLSGSFRVPGVFSSTLENAQVSVRRFHMGDRFEYQFEIQARENGREFPVYFVMSEMRDGDFQYEPLRGTAYLSADRKQVLGPFTVVRQAPALLNQ